MEFRRVLFRLDCGGGAAKEGGGFLHADAISGPDTRGGRGTDNPFLLLFHARHQDVCFSLLDSPYAAACGLACDTAAPLVEDRPPVKAGGDIEVEARSLLILRRAH